MTTENTMTQQTEKNIAERQTLKPLTDVYETKEGATLYVDLPGVGKEELDIDVDKNILSISGKINVNMPENLKPSYVDIPAAVYKRRFTLGDELDIEHIDANLKNGKLTLFIPRSERHKPRKIDVKVA
jgi:HSP20 family molecular chaperone IbpA